MLFLMGIINFFVFLRNKFFIMKKTVGSTDKIIRVLLALAIGYFTYSTSFDAAWIQLVLYVVTVVLLITTFTGVCPLYAVFKINTCKLDG